MVGHNIPFVPNIGHHSGWFFPYLEKKKNLPRAKALAYFTRVVIEIKVNFIAWTAELFNI
jgi:hypothetical protein